VESREHTSAKVHNGKQENISLEHCASPAHLSFLSHSLFVLSSCKRTHTLILLFQKDSWYSTPLLSMNASYWQSS